MTWKEFIDLMNDNGVLPTDIIDYISISSDSEEDDICVESDKKRKTGKVHIKVSN